MLAFDPRDPAVRPVVLREHEQDKHPAYGWVNVRTHQWWARASDGSAVAIAIPDDPESRYAVALICETLIRAELGEFAGTGPGEIE